MNEALPFWLPGMSGKMMKAAVTTVRGRLRQSGTDSVEK